MRRRPDPLAILARLRRHEARQIAHELAGHDEALMRQARQSALLKDRMAERADPSFPEAAYHTANHVRHIADALRREARRTAAIEQDARALRDKLRMAFVSLKQAETLVAARQARDRAEQGRREQRDAEERFRALRQSEPRRDPQHGAETD